MKLLGAMLSLFLSFIAPLACQAQEREAIVFSTTQNTVPGESIYVLGDLPELGANDMTRAVKLEPSAYPNWRAAISLPTGRSYSYSFVKRLDAPSQQRVATNGSFVSTTINAQTTPVAHSPASKAIIYHSSWTQPILWWRQGSGTYSQAKMLDIGPGRNTSERRWLAIFVGLSRRDLDFYITPSLGAGRDPSSGAYITPLDALFLQDGQVFDYVPPASVAPGFRNYSATNLPRISSVNLGGEQRAYRVWLPRGYSANPSRRYPVLYMHDGQNVFEPGPFGTWNADSAAAAQIARGALRELIIVGVDNTSNRFINYVPPEDITPSAQQGQADDYVRFIRDELKPVIDAGYRTLPDSANTGAMGSSMGGLVSLYMGWDYPETFSRIGAMSNYWSTNFRNRILSQPKREITLYLDSGDSGTADDNYWPTYNVRDNFISPSRTGGAFAHGGDFRHVIGFNQQHNESAWAQRVGPAMAFLFPTTSVASELTPIATSAQFDVSSPSGTSLDDAYDQALSGSRDVNMDAAINDADARAIAAVVRRFEASRLLAR